jgi:hypothetical protein
VHARVAVAVQFQVSRVFWMIDLLAVVYAVWLIVDWRRTSGNPAVTGRPGRAAVAIVLVVAALSRGSYVMFAEKAGRPLVSLTFPADEWHAAMRWIARTPPGSAVLADPGHAWRYGTSVRVSGERDVFLEEVKDIGMAMYSRPVAMRVLDRIRALGDFRALTPEAARRLAARYALDYLVTEQVIDLPVVYRNRRFTIYAIRAR